AARSDRPPFRAGGAERSRQNGFLRAAPPSTARAACPSCSSCREQLAAPFINPPMSPASPQTGDERIAVRVLLFWLTEMYQWLTMRFDTYPRKEGAPWQQRRRQRRRRRRSSGSSRASTQGKIVITGVRTNTLFYCSARKAALTWS